MSHAATLLRAAVAAIFLGLSLLPAARADESRLDQLFDLLQERNLPNWQVIEEEIHLEWSKSGSPAMDLLLIRGRSALEAGDTAQAIEHFTALTDHAPDFPEGFNARAAAYFQAGLYGPALDDIARTLALEPRHFAALTGLGAILEELGQKTRALDAFRAAQAVHPHAPNLKDAIARLQQAVAGTRI